MMLNFATSAMVGLLSVYTGSRYGSGKGGVMRRLVHKVGTGSALVYGVALVMVAAYFLLPLLAGNEAAVGAAIGRAIGWALILLAVYLTVRVTLWIGEKLWR